MKQHFEFDCDCGGKTPYECHVLIWVTKEFDVRCDTCHSIWRVKVRGVTDGTGIKGSWALKRGSQKLADVLQKKKQHEFANRPQKKAPVFYNPGIVRKA